MSTGKWGGEDVRGQIIGDFLREWVLSYDGRYQASGYVETQVEAVQIAREKRDELTRLYGGHPCYLYQDKEKGELKVR